MARPKRTGRWYKIRCWSKRNGCWQQLRELPATEKEAITKATIIGETSGFRTQAIHLLKKGKAVELTVVYDSETLPPEEK